MASNIDDVRLFVYVIKEGSLKKASDCLNIPLPTLSRRLSALEERIAGKLLFRNCKRLELTPLGVSYYRCCLDCILEIDETLSALALHNHSMVGEIKLTSPRAIFHHLLEDKLIEFQRIYPEIKFNVQLSISPDSINTQSDIIIQPNIHAPPDYTMRKLSTTKFLLCASPSYLNLSTQLDSPDDLKNHKIIKVMPYDKWTFKKTSGGNETDFILTSNYTTTSNDIEFAKKLVIQGMGITLLPFPIIRKHIVSGDLIHCLSQWETHDVSHYLLYAHHRNIPLRLKVLIDFLTKNTTNVM